MDRLQGKVAIVTGAAGGIGKATAILFAQEGARVLVTDLQAEKMGQWVAQQKEEGHAIEYIVHDVTADTDWQKVVQKALDLWGRIDILVNNAGVYFPGLTMDNTDRKTWDKVLAINLTGPCMGVQACIPHMRENGGGAIVNISSIAGLVGGNGAAYSASKAGLTLLSKDNAVELAKDNIRVNSIHPGGVLTPMTQFMEQMEGADELVKNLCPMARMGKPEEIAYGALFLASNEASYVTGAELVIDGGLTAR